MGKQIGMVREATMQKRFRWHWAGNVRELENMIERGVILSQDSVLEIQLTEPTQSAIPALNEYNGGSTLKAFEREHILQALRGSGWVIGGPDEAAGQLRLTPSTLNTRMRQLGINRPPPQ